MSNKKHAKIMKFAQWTMDRIGIKNRPDIELTDDIAIVKKHRAYGATTSDGKIWVYVGDRTPADTMRTLCHEILHAKQFEDGVASDYMDDEQEQYIEDLANAHAGRLMRKYGKKDASIYEDKKINESREGSLIHDVADSLPYAFVIPELTVSDNPYLQYKFSVAMASARGKKSRDQDKVHQFRDPSVSEYFRDEQVVVSYDPDIEEVIDLALKDIGITSGKRVIGVKGSQEPRDTSTKSPVQGFRGFGSDK